MKSNYAPKSAPAANANEQRLTAAGFSRRLARPSIGRTVASLTSNLRANDLWDFALIDRLQSPLTRRHY